MLVVVTHKITILLGCCTKKNLGKVKEYAFTFNDVNKYNAFTSAVGNQSYEISINQSNEPMNIVTIIGKVII